MTYTLMTPGPVPVPVEVLKILAQPMEHHRTPEFAAVLDRVLKRLKAVFGTQERAFILTSTGSGGLECALVNVLSPGDEVLAIVSGKFGERWAEMAQTYGAVVQRIDVEWGHAVEASQVKAALAKNPNIKIVLCQACETSTGVLHPIKEIAAITKQTEALLLVDGITALGAMPMPMDEWGIDCVVGGSQKAFMLPTGLSLVSFSKRAWERIEKAKCPRFYFDIRAEREANERGETLFSTPVPLVKALDFILEKVEREGLASIMARIEKVAAATRGAASELGLTNFAKSPSPTLTAILLPTDIDGQKVRSEMEKKHRVTVMGGQDQLKGRVIRIGHMGAIKNEDVIVTVQAFGAVLNSMKPDTFTQAKIDKAVEAAKRLLA